MEYIYIFCDWEMKYVFHSFGPLASFQDVKSIYRVVLVLFYSVAWLQSVKQLAQKRYFD